MALCVDLFNLFLVWTSSACPWSYSGPFSMPRVRVGAHAGDRARVCVGGHWVIGREGATAGSSSCQRCEIQLLRLRYRSQRTQTTSASASGYSVGVGPIIG